MKPTFARAATLALTLFLSGARSDAAKIALTKRAGPEGIDVSGYQPTVDWAAAKANGVQFAYIKATEGTSTLGFIF
jgi:GH25 family lysozyme M1 (1,4-beta-N-acetylmuramidase)